MQKQWDKLRLRAYPVYTLVFAHFIERLYTVIEESALTGLMTLPPDKSARSAWTVLLLTLIAKRMGGQSCCPQ
jgi:DMSO/TMAO reductase YedYZ heme-binding membrane subunit